MFAGPEGERAAGSVLQKAGPVPIIHSQTSTRGAWI